jgi:hypothetical protein
MASLVPQNFWQGNAFMMPSLARPTRQAFPLEQFLAEEKRKQAADQAMQTSGVNVPGYITEGKSGAEKGAGGVGNSFSYGAPEYGMEAGKSATGTNTTTSSTDWGDVAKMGAMNALPGIGSLMSVTGMTDMAKGYLSSLMGPPAQSAQLANDPSYAMNTPTALAEQALAAQNAYGDQQGFGNEGGLGIGADPSQAGNTGDASSESPGLYNKGGVVRSLVGPNPPGPDDGYGGLDRGEVVIAAGPAKKHRSLLLALNSGASNSKLRSLLG